MISALTRLFLRVLFCLIIPGVALQSCISVESYQKMYLNDSDMALKDEAIRSFETNFQSYREGASGGRGGKTGGGCGCN